MKYLIILLGISLIIGSGAEDVSGENIEQSEIASTLSSSSSTESSTQSVSISSTSTEKVEITSEKHDEPSTTTIAPAETVSEITISSSTEKVPVESSSSASTADPSKKRKTILINQQQNGKMNVQLELSDVSVIVIPNQKENPQLSLLNLLFKSAQKRQNEERKKEENALKSINHGVGSSNIADYHHDQYSKIHSTRPSNDENYTYDLKSEPFIESRAPYRVDISSTLVQQTHPAIEISPNSQPKMLKKRAIDSRLLGVITGPSETTSWMEEEENSLGEEPIANILRGSEEDDDLIHNHESEFTLLGAVENCGPGRRRNSYQICVPIDYDDMF